MHTVFVYGTLKTGERNHFLMERENCKFIGSAKTVDKYPLVIATMYNIPFLLYRLGEGHHVLGEVYQVDEEGLAILDELEMHPKLYERFKINVNLLNTENNEDTVPALCYFLVKFRPALMSLPMFESYSRNIEGYNLRLPDHMSSEELEIQTKQMNWSEVHTEFYN